MDQGKTKIAIISLSLGDGGAERFAGALGFMLSDLDYEIHHITINDNTAYPFSGVLCNLGKLCQGDSGVFKKIKKGFLLRNYLQSENIDFVIDNRTRNNFIRELFTAFLYGNRKKYYVIHSYHLENYLPKSALLAKLLYRNAAKLICVSKAIEEKVIREYGFKNTQTIYNAVEVTSNIDDFTVKVPEQYILFYGRLEEKVKNFTLLLQAFEASKIFEKGYQLLIIGEGSSKKAIQQTVAKLQLDDFVTIMPFQKNPFPYVSKAKFTVLTSYYEGFPMSIIESLSLGTPVVSVDCLSGPSEIIAHEQNGLLTENHNVVALSQAMVRMVADDTLYQKLKTNAAGSVAHLAPSAIASQWERLFKA